MPIIQKLAQQERANTAAKLQEAKVDRDAAKDSLQKGNAEVNKLTAQLQEIDDWLAANKVT